MLQGLDEHPLLQHPQPGVFMRQRAASIESQLRRKLAGFCSKTDRVVGTPGQVNLGQRKQRVYPRRVVARFGQCRFQAVGFAILRDDETYGQQPGNTNKYVGFHSLSNVPKVTLVCRRCQRKFMKKEIPSCDGISKYH